MSISTMHKGVSVFVSFSASIRKSWDNSPKKFTKDDAANLQSLRRFVCNLSQIDINPTKQVTLLQLLAAVNGRSVEGMCFRSDKFVGEVMSEFVQHFPEYFPEGVKVSVVKSSKKSVSLDDILV